MGNAVEKKMIKLPGLKAGVREGRAGDLNPVPLSGGDLPRPEERGFPRLDETSQCRSGLVAIVGRPNAGKSTLLNTVLQTRISIVTPKAQTTRERVLGILTDEARGQLLFLDTPGIHRAKEGGINEYMVHEAKQALDEPNIVWYLIDPNSAPEHEIAVVDLISRSVAPLGVSLFILMNKTDRILNPELAKWAQRELQERGFSNCRVFEISGLKRRGLDELMEATWSATPVGQPFYPDADQLSDRPSRFFVAEKIREQLFHSLGDEIPYSCAIQIERFDEKVKPPRIEASICVERDSQKGMVIGKGGKKIKEIGQAARQDIEEFLGYSIFLGLKVKVIKDWTRDARALKNMGYTLPDSRTQKGRSSS